MAFSAVGRYLLPGEIRSPDRMASMAVNACCGVPVSSRKGPRMRTIKMLRALLGMACLALSAAF
jgi:hypothetical protein